MTKILRVMVWTAMLLTACADDAPPPPLCEDVGCPDTALCDRQGVCSCVPPDEGPPGITCVLDPP